MRSKEEHFDYVMKTLFEDIETQINKIKSFEPEHESLKFKYAREAMGMIQALLMLTRFDMSSPEMARANELFDVVLEEMFPASDKTA